MSRPLGAPGSKVEEDHRGLVMARVAAGVAALGSVVGVLLLLGADTATLGPYGLVHALPWGIYPVMALQAVAFIAALRLPRQRTLLLLIPLAGVILLLHGAASIAQPVARFPTAWIHAGFAEHILTDGGLLQDLDARFSWPGFFAAAASFTRAAGLDRPDLLLRWAPLFFLVAYLPPLLVITRSILDGWRAPWVVLWAFLFINWVGQDYFAPQSLALLLALGVLAVCVRWFSDPPPSERRWWKRLDIAASRAREPQDLAAGRGVRAGLLLLVVFMGGAVAVSHQLTPFVLTGFLAALWLVRRLRPATLPVVMGLLALGWTSYAATAYWAFHLDDMFGSAGDVSGVVASTLTDRLGGSPEHLQLLGLRMGFTALVWVVAVVGLVRRVRQVGEGDLTALALAATPFALIAVQTYGGEGLLRVFLLSSPFVAVFVARAFVPVDRLGRVAAVALLVASVGLMPLFHAARYGNESFERVTVAELEVVEQLYGISPAGSTLVAVSPQLAWRHRDIGDYDHRTANAAGYTDDSVASLQAMFPEGQESYLVVTAGQLEYVERVFGADVGWGQDLVAQLDDAPAFDVVFRNEDGTVYRYTRKDEA